MTRSPTTIVGVERLLYLRTSSMTACWSTLTSRTSKWIPFSERWALAQSQGGQPGWLKTKIFFCSILVLSGAAALYFFTSSRSATMRISVLMRAVLFSIAATEQYFSSESRTASSTDFTATGPETVKTSLMAV